jgi:hypothetical protein
MTCSTLRGRGWVLSRTDWTFHWRAGRPPIDLHYDLSWRESKQSLEVQLADPCSQSWASYNILYWTRNQQCDGRSHFSAQQAALPYRCLNGPFAETYSFGFGTRPSSCGSAVNWVGFTVKAPNCSTLLQDFGRIACRIGLATLAESNN